MRIILALLVAAVLQDEPMKDQAAAQKFMAAQGPGVAPGKDAPDFKLRRLKEKPDDPEEHVQLSDFKGKRPVVLIFGSYT